MKGKVRLPVTRAADRDDDTDGTLLSSLGLTALLLPCPEIRIGDHLAGTKLTAHRHSPHPAPAAR